MISSCFSFFFLAADHRYQSDILGSRFNVPSLRSSFFAKSSFMSCVSLVLFRRISSFRFLSSLSCSDVPALFSASFVRSLEHSVCSTVYPCLYSCGDLTYSSSFAFFSSSVKGAISWVDSSKSLCPVLLAWNSAWATLRSCRPQSLHKRDLASSPGCKAIFSGSSFS